MKRAGPGGGEVRSEGGDLRLTADRVGARTMRLRRRGQCLELRRTRSRLGVTSTCSRIAFQWHLTSEGIDDGFGDASELAATIGRSGVSSPFPAMALDRVRSCDTL